MTASLTDFAQDIATGKLRVIGVASEARSPLYPSAPTIREQGFPSVVASGWYGFMVPAATPVEVVARLQSAALRALDDPAMAAARTAVQRILDAHEPWPALAMDRHWNLVMHNRLVPLLMAGAAPELLQGPVNVLRLSLHPQGLAPRIANLRQWREHLFERLRQQIRATGDAVLAALLEELKGYPDASESAPVELPGEHPGVLMPFQFHTPHGVLQLVSTTTVFGSPVDITLQELAMETFFPADEATATALRGLLASASV